MVKVWEDRIDEVEALQGISLAVVGRLGQLLETMSVSSITGAGQRRTRHGRCNWRPEMAKWRRRHES